MMRRNPQMLRWVSIGILSVLLAVAPLPRPLAQHPSDPPGALSVTTPPENNWLQTLASLFGPALTAVGLDGGYVHAKEQKSRTEGWFEVIVGKSLPQEGAGKCLAFVQKYDQKPKRRLYEVLQAQGVQANQSVIFLSDGGETVRNLPEFLIPESEHWPDWFHITLQLTRIGQMIKGLEEVSESGDHSTLLSPDDEFPSERVSIGALEKTRESMKWNVWNGNVPRVRERTEGLIDDLETWPPEADKVVREDSL